LLLIFEHITICDMFLISSRIKGNIFPAGTLVPKQLSQQHTVSGYFLFARLPYAAALSLLPTGTLVPKQLSQLPTFSGGFFCYSWNKLRPPP
jgi:hypothetical protein